MINKLAKITTTFVLLVSPLLAATSVSAQPQGNDLCSVFGQLCDVFGGAGNGTAGDDATSFVLDRFGLGVSLIFVGIMIVAVFIIIKSGVKYIQSQGDEGQVEEAQKAMKSVFIGLGLLFVGIIGIVLFLAFFGGTGILGTDRTIEDVFNPS